MKVTVLILDPPSFDRAKKVVGLLRSLMMLGADVSVYLLGDGVYWGVKEYLEKFNLAGVNLFAGKSDLEARGIKGDLLSENVNVIVEIVDRLIEEVMEESDRVLSV